jgi:ubiquinone/menaquinone biosynthesis C-methylase UbiE
MNPLLKHTLGRLPLFRSVKHPPGEAPPPTPEAGIREREQLLAKLDTLHEHISPEPHLVPPPELMRSEGIRTLEEWFRRGEEWSTLLRAYGNVAAARAVLEIGCGLGDVAMALRDVLPRASTYEGLDAGREKIEFLQTTMTPAYANFRFQLAEGGGQHRLPYEEGLFELVFAVSAFTHLLPEAASTVLAEIKRVLASQGQCVLGMFLLDYYETDRPRPAPFDNRRYNVEQRFGSPGPDEFCVADTQDPTDITAYSSGYLAQLAGQAGLRLAHHPIPGMWSGSTREWVGRLDLVVLEHTPAQTRDVSYLDRL